VTSTTGRADASGTSRPKRRAARGFLVAGVVLLVLVAIVVVADLVVRSIAQTTVAQAVEDELPPQVSGEVTAQIGGFSVLAQLIAGTAEQVELSAPELLVDGTPIAVDVVATDVPLDLSQPVGRIDAELRIDQASLDQLAVAQGVVGDLTLGDGVVGYTGSLTILGLPIEYRATAEPEAAGDRVLLRPVGAEVTAGGASLDLSGAVDAVLGGDPVEICVADRLPAGVSLQSIDVTTDEAVLRLGGTGLILDEAHLTQTGSC
jgi:hypothetical protein